MRILQKSATQLQSSIPHHNTMNNPLQSFTFRLPSEHTLMTSFFYFNSKRDRFLSCGQQGQINIYKIGTGEPGSQNNNKIIKLGYASVFDEAVTCVDWALGQAGGCVAVGGSKGGLAVLRVDQVSGRVVVEKMLSLGTSVPCSLSWHGLHQILLIGTVDGRCYSVDNELDQWAINKDVINFNQNSPVQVGNGIPNSHFQMASIDNTLYQIFTFMLKKQTPSLKIAKFESQKILALLSRPQNALNYLQIYVLTDKKLRSYDGYTSMDSLTTSLELKCQLDVEKLGCDSMAWGWGFSELVLASTRAPKKEEKGEGGIRSPIVVKIKLNGKFILTK